MGGSSLCPDVLARTFGRVQGYPELLVLDSTDPAQIRAMEARIDLAKTLFIVSSKSGTTLEPNILKDYFFDRVGHAVGAERRPAKHFIAVTDPGSALQQVAEAQKLPPGVLRRARASAGDTRRCRTSAWCRPPSWASTCRASSSAPRSMAHACASCVPPEQNPGVLLGAILGTLARAGRDKVTLIASPGVVAARRMAGAAPRRIDGQGGQGHRPRSTRSRSVRPTSTAPTGCSSTFGSTTRRTPRRMRRSLRSRRRDTRSCASRSASRTTSGRSSSAGRSRPRWPARSSASTRSISPTSRRARSRRGSSPMRTRRPARCRERAPFYRDGALALFADERNHVALEQAVGSDKTLRGYLRAHLARLKRGDYFALLAYIERNDAHEPAATDDRGAPSAIPGTSPPASASARAFSTRPDRPTRAGRTSGVFLQLTCDDAQDLQVPGHRFSFGVVKAAQARGDFRVLGAAGPPRAARSSRAGRRCGSRRRSLRAISEALA